MVSKARTPLRGWVWRSLRRRPSPSVTTCKLLHNAPGSPRGASFGAASLSLDFAALPMGVPQSIKFFGGSGDHSLVHARLRRGDGACWIAVTDATPPQPSHLANAGCG